MKNKKNEKLMIHIAKSTLSVLVVGAMLGSNSISAIKAAEQNTLTSEDNAQTLEETETTVVSTEGETSTEVEDESANDNGKSSKSARYINADQQWRFAGDIFISDENGMPINSDQQLLEGHTVYVSYRVTYTAGSAMQFHNLRYNMDVAQRDISPLHNVSGFINGRPLGMQLVALENVNDADGRVRTQRTYEFEDCNFSKYDELVFTYATEVGYRQNLQDFDIHHSLLGSLENGQQAMTLNDMEISKQVSDGSVEHPDIYPEGIIKIDPKVVYLQYGALSPNYMDGVFGVDTNSVLVTPNRENSVDTTKPGSQDVTYSFTDRKGNKISNTRTYIVKNPVGMIKPVIEFPSPATITVEKNEVPDYRKGVRAYDNFNNKLSFTVDDSAVRLDTPGEYTVYYSAENAVGRTVAQRTVVVNDLSVTKPKFEFSTPSEIVTEIGKTPDYRKGVRAYDNLNPNLLFMVNSSDVNIHKEGTYTVHYMATNKAGMTFATRTVIVKKQQLIKPIIEFDSPKIVVENGVAPDYRAGVRAYDNYNTELPFTVDDSQVNLSVKGEYPVYYQANNAMGYTIKTRTVVVKMPVVSKPRFEFPQPSEIIIEEGTQPDYRKGVRAYDNLNSNLVFMVNASNVNINKAGTYTVYYLATNQAGNTLETRTVIVQKQKLVKPVIEFPSETMTVEVGETPDYKTGVHAYDNYNNKLPYKIDSSGVNVEVAGEYTAYYFAENAAGQTFRTRKVIVKEPKIIKPKFEFPTPSDIIVELGGRPDYRAGVRAYDNLNPNLTFMVNASEVNTNEEGTYTVYYLATNQAGMTLETRKVIVEEKKQDKSVIIVQPEVVNVDFGGKISDYLEGVEGYAIDSKGSTYPLSVSVSAGAPVDTLKSGEHTVTYEAQDKFGNTVSAKRLYVVGESKQPTLTIKPEKVDVLFGTNLTRDDYLSGVEAIDCLGQKLEVTVNGKVDTKKVGPQMILYTVKDSFGNTASGFRVYTVLQVANPTLNTGEKTIVVEKGMDLPNLLDGVNAKDAFGKDISDKIEITDDGGISSGKMGQYIVSYEVNDDFGNSSRGERLYVVGGKVSGEYVFFAHDAEISNDDLDESNKKLQIIALTEARVELLGNPGTPADVNVTLTNDGGYTRDWQGKLVTATLSFRGDKGTISQNVNIAIGYVNSVVSKNQTSIIANDFASDKVISEVIHRNLVAKSEKGLVEESVAYKILSTNSERGPRINSWNIETKKENMLNKKDILDAVEKFDQAYTATGTAPKTVELKITTAEGDIATTYDWHINQLRSKNTATNFKDDKQKITKAKIINAIRTLYVEFLLNEEEVRELANIYGIEFDDIMNSQDDPFTDDDTDVDDISDDDDWLIDLGIL